MLHALRAQWLILYRRPLLWVLLGIHVLTLLVQLLLPALLLKSVSQLSAGGQQGGPLTLTPEALAQLRTQALFPGAFATIFGQINSVGGLLLMIFCGAFIGSDFGWGTARTQLLWQPNRRRYLLVRLLALLPLALLMVLLTLALGMGLGLLNSALLGAPTSLSLAQLPALAAGCLRALYGLLPYMLLAAACAVAGRSALAGVAGSLFFWIVESGLALLAILQFAGPAGRAIYNLTLAQNVSALTELTRRSFGVSLQGVAGNLDLSFPPPGQAVLLLLLYSLLLIGSALLLISRRDISGPA